MLAYYHQICTACAADGRLYSIVINWKAPLHCLSLSLFLCMCVCIQFLNRDDWQQSQQLFCYLPKSRMNRHRRFIHTNRKEKADLLELLYSHYEYLSLSLFIIYSKGTGRFVQLTILEKIGPPKGAR